MPPRFPDLKDGDPGDEVPVAALGDLARQCYQAIIQHFQNDGYPPTRLELSSALKVSLRMTGVALGSLESAGLIQVNLATDRGIRLLTPEGVVCPCCGGNGILPDRATVFDWPAGKRRGTKWFAAITPKFLPHEDSFRGIRLNAVEMATLKDILVEFPDDHPAIVGRRFMEKTGRYLHANTIRKHRRQFVADGIISISETVPKDFRGVILTEAEVDLIGKLIRDNPSDGKWVIARRFREKTGRSITKETVKKYAEMQGFPLRSESKPLGCPPVNKDLIPLIQEMSEKNPGWTNVRLAAVLKQRTGRTVHRYTIGKYRKRLVEGYVGMPGRKKECVDNLKPKEPTP